MDDERNTEIVLEFFSHKKTTTTITIRRRRRITIIIIIIIIIIIDGKMTTMVSTKDIVKNMLRKEIDDTKNIL